MIYVFEDNGNDIFSRLFKINYTAQYAEKFKYLSGISKAQKVLSEDLKNNDTAVLFMDIVPDNQELSRIYTALRLLSLSNESRLIIILIPCIEYQFIQTVANLVSNRYIDRCLSYDYYGDLVNDFKSTRITSFEKYCKCVIKEKLPKCMSTDLTRLGEELYFTEMCKHNTILDRARSLLCTYPAVPVGELTSLDKPMNLAKCWEVHRETVNFYNEAVTRFSLAGIKARYIKPIK